MQGWGCSPSVSPRAELLLVMEVMEVMVMEVMMVMMVMEVMMVVMVVEVLLPWCLLSEPQILCCPSGSAAASVLSACCPSRGAAPCACQCH